MVILSICNSLILQKLMKVLWILKVLTLGSTNSLMQITQVFETSSFIRTSKKPDALGYKFGWITFSRICKHFNHFVELFIKHGS